MTQRRLLSAFADGNDSAERRHTLGVVPVPSFSQNSFFSPTESSLK